MYCQRCGNEIKPGDRFCENCGAETGYNDYGTKDPEKAPSGKSSALSLLLPGLGAYTEHGDVKGIIVFVLSVISLLVVVIPIVVSDSYVTFPFFTALMFVLWVYGIEITNDGTRSVRKAVLQRIDLRQDFREFFVFQIGGLFARQILLVTDLGLLPEFRRLVHELRHLLVVRLSGGGHSDDRFVAFLSLGSGFPNIPRFLSGFHLRGAVVEPFAFLFGIAGGSVAFVSLLAVNPGLGGEFSGFFLQSVPFFREDGGLLMVFVSLLAVFPRFFAEIGDHLIQREKVLFYRIGDHTGSRMAEGV